MPNFTVYLYNKIHSLRYINMKLIKLLIVSLVALQTSAQTIVNTPTVHGHWTLSGSPYLIQNNIQLNYADTLTIDPGVNVLFQGYYYFLTYGTLKAAGTAALPINFKSADTTGWSNDLTNSGGWNGLFLYANPDSCTTLDYCNFSDVKNMSDTNTGVAIVSHRAFELRHCNLSHIKTKMVILAYTINNDISRNIFEADSSNFYNNLTQGAQFEFFDYPSDTIITKVNIKNSSFHDNAGGYMVLEWNTIADIENNTIFNNTFDSGSAAIYYRNDTSSNLNYHNKVTLYHNTIHDNTLVNVGPVNGDGPFFDINANLICNNQSPEHSDCGYTSGGGAIRISGSVDTNSVIRNNVISNNYSGYYGGGIYVFHSNIVIANNTIVHNTAYFGGKGVEIFGSGSNAKLKNNIFYGNENLGPTANDADLEYWSTSFLLFDNNWIAQPFSQAAVNTYGTTVIGDTTHNIIGSDPGLVNPTSTTNVNESALVADYHLLATSGCIDEGDTVLAWPFITDYAGNQRINNGTIDIGAYEYHVVPTQIQAQQAAVGERLAQFSPNPAQSFFSTQDQGSADEYAKVELYAITGRLAFSTVSKTSHVDIPSVIPDGLYMCRINVKGKILVGKLIIARQ